MMGLIGNLASLLAGGSRYVPPPPPTTPQTGPDSTQTTASAPPVAEGTPSTAAATKTAANSTGDPSAMTVVQPSQAAPTAAAQSVPRQGTPADSSPISADFSLAPRRADEESARAFAIAAQARERLGDLVKGLADAPDAAPALSGGGAEKPEQPLGGGGINATLPTLRGENSAGAVLDKVA
jgi:hypothetical protein